MRHLFFLSFFFIAFSAYSQHFSGEIQYELSIIPKVENLDVDSLIQKKKGTLTKYLITDGYYKSTHYQNGEVSYSYTYDNVSKSMYDDAPDDEYITYRDSRKSYHEYFGSEIYRDSTEIVNGYECFMVKHESEFANSTTYYSDQIKVNFESFRDHAVGNWYNKLKEVDGCISLKSIYEYDTYYEVREAVKITPMKLKPADFSLPTNKIIVASPLALDTAVELVPPSPAQIELYEELVVEGAKKLEPEASYVSYISFVLYKDGQIDYIEAMENDPHGFNKLAVEIFKQCDFKFKPGLIEDREVSSVAYLPIRFSR